jgi:GH15 family glucan-1,4-alpha-glucosidase
VANTLFQCRQAGLKPPKDEGEDVAQPMIEFLETAWDPPDDGIWEMRGPRRHFVHSKMMAWVAVDWAIRSAEQGWISGDIARWKTLRTTIHEQYAGKASTRASILLCRITARNTSTPVSS